MFIRMKLSKGFTLVELMIVVAIIGILATVAVPYYQKYIQKARLTSLVWPGIHMIQTDVGCFYSFNGAFPTQADLGPLLVNANSDYFSVAINGTTLTFTLSKEGNGTNPLHVLSGQALVATVLENEEGLVTGWSYSGPLAQAIGLQGIQ